MRDRVWRKGDGEKGEIKREKETERHREKGMNAGKNPSAGSTSETLTGQSYWNQT